jgi:hypothetical protein
MPFFYFSYFVWLGRVLLIYILSIIYVFVFYKFNKLLIYNRSKYYLIENINLLRLNYTSNNHSFLQSLIIARDIKKKN